MSGAEVIGRRATSIERAGDPSSGRSTASTLTAEDPLTTVDVVVAEANGTVSYVDVGRPAEFDATCEGGTEFNGFYGFGIVDAYAAVTARAWWEHR